MARIHPTAVVEKDVQLAEDVVIGPYCVVGNGVSLGPGTILDARAVVTGPTTLGRDNHIYPNTVLGCCPQILGVSGDQALGGLVIGDRNVIRENVTMHTSRHPGTATRIGSDSLFMVGTHIGHDCVVEDKVVLSNSVQIGGHVHIENGVWLSGMAACHQFVTIGRWAYVAGLAGLTHDVPPFLIVSGHYPSRIRGVNKRGMVRAGLSDDQQRRICEAYRMLYRRGGSLLANARALAEQDGLDENVRALLDAIFHSNQHRFGRYQETLRTG